MTDVAATDRTPIATNVTYSVSGAPLGYTLVDDATTPYAQLSREYDQQGMLRRHAWLALGVAAWQDQVFKYNDAGMLMTVTDAGAPAHGRRYEYDRLARMTCEVAGDPETSGACATSNPAVLGRFTYHDGASTSAPPAHRATMFTRTPYHAATAAESAAYTPWTNRAQSVQRGNDTLVITYDGLGRRTADYLASQPVASRRDYAYSPDGHLHTTTTSRRHGHAHVRHRRRADVDRRARGDGGPPVRRRRPPRRCAGHHGWHGARLGVSLPPATCRSLRRAVATSATGRRQTASASCTIGVASSRTLSPPRATRFMRRTTTLPASPRSTATRFLWMPFALPGQLVLADTAATGRGPLAANGARAYDADLGIFLAPDPADPVARIVPEGYAYARNNPLHFADPSGGAAMTYWDTDDHPFYGPERTFFVDQGCDPAMAQMVRAALRQAITAIASCTDGACGPLGGTALRARWLYSLSVGRYACENRETKTATYGPLSYKFVNGTLPGHGAAFTDAGAVAGNKRMQGLLRQKVTFLGSDISLMCLAGNLAHEALHPALLSLDAHDLHAPQRPEWAEVFLAGAAMVDSRRVTRSERAAGAVDSEYPNSSFTGDTEPQNYQQPDEAYIKNAVKRCGLCD
ncbi:MAG: hypothetical protein IPL61_04915 [Myxococcales bacterium]|nr:hypothetical protein [Myxococcales bacterium]